MQETLTLSLDIYLSTGIGVLALLLGAWLNRTVPFLKKFCIPSPVSGGIIVSLITLALHSFAGVDVTFDGTLKDIFMMVFFTSVGYQSNLKVLKQGGMPLLVMIVLVAVIVVCQNLISVGMSTAMGLGGLFGMTAGSVPMLGGHGTAGGFSALFESMGLEGASSIMMAAATFGLISGSLIGGPIAQSLVSRHHLCSEGENPKGEVSEEKAPFDPDKSINDYSLYREKETTMAVFFILITLAVGSILSRLLAKTGITFPTYFGSLLVGVFVRNIFEFSPKIKDSIPVRSIVEVGNICLSLFLGMAMVSLKLWELAGLALPLFGILFTQVVFLGLFAYFVAFRLLGRNYDAAVLVGGLCGFGLGATPNAMANMSAVTLKYRPAVNPFIIVPIVGAMFADLINTTVITVFLNII